MRNSTVETFWDAVAVGGLVTNSNVTITGNRITDADFALDLGAVISTFEVDARLLEATNAAPEELDHAGILVETYSFRDLVTRLSRFSIHDNDIRVSDTCGCMMFGMWLQDASWGATDHWFTATITHNTISLPTTFTLIGEGKEGIDANNITGSVISDNTFTGTSAGTWDAISLWGNDPSLLPSKGNLITGNHVSGLKPAGSQPYPDFLPGLGLSQIYLDPYTTGNTVVCARPSDTAYDAGTGNKVIGCTAPALTAAAAPNVSPMLRQASGAQAGEGAAASLAPAPRQQQAARILRAAFASPAGARQGVAIGPGSAWPQGEHRCPGAPFERVRAAQRGRSPMFGGHRSRYRRPSLLRLAAQQHDGGRG